MTEQILPFVGEVVAYGGGATIIAYLVFQFFGKTWIENKFAQSLEQLRHQQALELQRLRVEIDSMLRGVIKIQEKEFETLPEAWQKLDEACCQVFELVHPLQYYPDLDRMTPAESEEFLSKSELSETEKSELHSSQNKLKTYQEIIFWHRLRKVEVTRVNFRNYVARNGIFFPPGLKEQFSRIAELLWSALSDKEIGHKFEDYKMQYEGWKKIKDEVEPLYKSIEAEIHTRLHSHGRKT